MQSEFGRCQCDGWWEQDWYGRQPMNDLQITFENMRVSGTGTDVLGPFALTGVIAESGAVMLRKQYIKKHMVEYFGSYDGEGVMTGEWRIEGLRGRWMIAIRRVEKSLSTEIREFRPGG